MEVTYLEQACKRENRIMASGNDWTTKNHRLLSPGCTLEAHTCGAQEAPPVDPTTDRLDYNIWGRAQMFVLF